jgi:predicted phage-related endonuclease
MPLHVLIQTAVEMHLTGAAWGVVVALSIGSGIELHIHEMPVIDGLMQKLLSANKDFWQMVESGTRPPPDYGRDLALIQTLNKAVADPVKTVDLSGDNAFVNAVKEYLDASAAVSAHSKQKARAEAEIRDKLGDASAATAGDFSVTAKLVNRTEHTVKATSYRQLRVKDASA